MTLINRPYLIILIFAVVFFSIFLLYNTQKDRILIWSLYQNYKKEYIDPVSFRVVDKQTDGVTTSEGQSYGMLMSMWMNDQDTFDKIWQWTQNNLQISGSSSFSWLWGKNQTGEYKILTEKGGDNVATDGDIDIAFSLIKAYKKWGNENYIIAAKKIVQDIWNNEVILTKNGKYVLSSNNLDKKYQKSQILVNPSYFNPAAFREFGRLGLDLKWDRLLSDSFDILELSSSSNLGYSKPIFLPPDWIFVDSQNGAITPTNNPSFKTNFGFDAARIVWRTALSLDLSANQEPLALKYLEKLDYFRKEWRNKDLLYTVYGHDGTVQGKYESKFMYSTSLGYFKYYDQNSGDQIVEKKLNSSDVADQPMSYYDSSWVFFGLALYHGYLT